MNLSPTGDRRFTLGIVIAGLIPAFAITHLVVSRYKLQREGLGQEWAMRGAQDLARSPALAVADFQTALSYRPDEVADRLRLAEALIADHRPAEAKAHLLTLWADEPGDGRVSLDLARLSATEGDLGDAVRYYHAAIDGAWQTGATVARRAARLELARLLLSHGQRVMAQAELIALVDDLPPDPVLITEIGGLLVDTGADSRAIALFQQALTLDPGIARAALLAGEVEYRAGQYAAARRYLEQAARNGASFDRSMQLMLDVSGRVPALDPYAPRLSTRERARRAMDGLAIADERLQRCQQLAPGPDADRVVALNARVAEARKRTLRQISRDPDLIDEMVNLSFDVEALPSAICGLPSVDDRALQLIAAQRGPQGR